MRCRRHINGSSNAAQGRPGSAGSPSRAFVARQRGSASADPPDRSLQDAGCKANSGAVTARRPQTAHLANEVGQSSKRRVQSARGEIVPPAFETEVALTFGSDSTRPSSSPLDTFNPSNLQVPLANHEVSTEKVHQRNQKHIRRTGTIEESLSSAMEHFGAILQDRYEGKRSLRAAFLNWDGDKDGRITRHEVELMIKTLGISQRLGDQEVEAVLRHVAALPGSCLHYEDFCRLICQRAVEVGGTNQSAFSPRQISRARRVEEPVCSEQALYPNTLGVVELLRNKYQTRKLRSVFRNWDMDKDGCVTMQELDNNLRRQNVRLNPQQLQELFTSFDLDGDGKLLYHEFVKMVNSAPDKKNSRTQGNTTDNTQKGDSKTVSSYPVLRTQALNASNTDFVEMKSTNFRANVLSKLQAFAPRLNDAYAAFDDDHNGNLSYLEFRQGLQQLGLHFTEREFLHLATTVDTDGSGEISFKEFCQMFSKSRDTATGMLTWPEPTKAATVHNGGSFDFSHLSRRAKIPTRMGKTTYHDTGGFLRHDPGNGSTQAQSRFILESQTYGSGVSASSASAISLAQEDKHRRSIAHVNRLQRIRTQLESYNAQREQTHKAEEAVQTRHIQRLQNQHAQYQEAIDERPRYVRTGGKAAVLPRESMLKDHGFGV